MILTEAVVGDVPESEPTMPQVGPETQKEESPSRNLRSHQWFRVR